MHFQPSRGVSILKLGNNHWAKKHTIEVIELVSNIKGGSIMGKYLSLLLVAFIAFHFIQLLRGVYPDPYIIGMTMWISIVYFIVDYFEERQKEKNKVDT